MAWRIHKSVIKGEIDNRVRGRVTGELWLAGEDESLVLDLSGNCLADLAGCLVHFENPDPRRDEDIPIGPVHTGEVGDMTASRKVRILDVSPEKAMRLSRTAQRVPSHSASALYLEWFDQKYGRVVIESADYKVTVSPPSWQPTGDEAQEQIEKNREALEDWLRVLGPGNSDEDFDPEAGKPLDEFGYEKLLRESDARTEKYLKLFEKYFDHPDREEIIARELGGEWLEDQKIIEDAEMLAEEIDWDNEPFPEPDPATEGVDWARGEDGDIYHPLEGRVFDSGLEMLHYCETNGLLDENADPDLKDMVFDFQTTGAKLAGALGGLAYGKDLLEDSGFIVACLKRALNYLHKSMEAADKVATKNLLPTERLEAFRREQFAVREEILSLMKRFREASQ